MAFLIDIKKQNVIPNHRVSDVYIIYQIVGAVRKAECSIIADFQNGNGKKDT